MLVRHGQSARSLAEQQAQRFRLVQQLGQGPATHWPIITLSREFGAQGAAVGEAVAERLGFAFWDQELLHRIASETGAVETLLATLDERARSRLEDFLAETIVGSAGTGLEYVRQVTRVVHTLDQHGSAVVIGRGSQFLVAPERALHVRVIAPLAQRVTNYAQSRGVSLDNAEHDARAADEERVAFARRYFAQDPRNPVHYDLVINTGTFARPDAADMILLGYERKFGRLPAARLAR